MSILLRNPHSVLATLNHRPQDVLEVFVPQSIGAKNSSHGSGFGDAWERVIQIAKEKRILISNGATRSSRPARGAPQQESTRGSLYEARIAERSPVDAEILFKNASTRAAGRGLWIALDGLTDPHNVGAIFRSAAFFGVQGILMTQDRSAPLTGTVYDVAAGGVESVPFTVQINLQRAFEVAKDLGLWTLGTSEHVQDSYLSVQRDRPWLLVLGNEEKGMRRLTEEACDVLCGIQALGKVTSLNVSVAAGILIARLTEVGS